MMTTQQRLTKYGVPNEAGTYLVTVTLPFPVRIAWDKNTSVRKIRVHKQIAEPILKVFKQIFDHYGYERIKELGIDIYAGVFNFRKMRNGNNWSAHAWGLAIDLDPERNGLKTPWAKSQFSKPEYAPMIKAFYDHGFINLGAEKGFDSMHFEWKGN